jgi:hypothetical protein
MLYVQGLLIVIALLMFLLAGAGKRPRNDFQYIPIGLFCWCLATTIPLLKVVLSR